MAPTPDAVSALSRKMKYAFLKVYRAFDNAYADIQVYSQYDPSKLKEDYDITAETIEEYNGKFNNVKEELKKDPDDPDDPDFNTAIAYTLRCYHADQIDEDYILKLMEATRSDESALFLLNTGKTQKIIQEINEEIQRFRKTNPVRAEILETIWKEYQDNPARFVNQNFADVLNDRVNARKEEIIKDFSREWCVDPDALSYFVDTYDIRKDPKDLKDKQVNQDTLLKKYAHPKEYRKTHPSIGLKYPRLLLENIRNLYVHKLQKLIER